MATITTNTSRLPVLNKCERGASIVAKSTDNPLVPGNAAQLAIFSTTQDALVAANAEVEAVRSTLAQVLASRDVAEQKWDGEVAQLAVLTQAVTNGDPVAMLSAGFGVRGQNTPPQPLPAPENVTAGTNGSPGITKVRWRGLAGAVSYLVESSPDPITGTSWRQVATPTKASCEVDGAEPGKPCWFRVAGVNPLGVGPWSAPALRAVM